MYLQERFLSGCTHIFSLLDGWSFCTRLQTVSGRAVCHLPDPTAPQGTALARSMLVSEAVQHLNPSPTSP